MKNILNREITMFDKLDSRGRLGILQMDARTFATMVTENLISRFIL